MELTADQEKVVPYHREEKDAQNASQRVQDGLVSLGEPIQDNFHIDVSTVQGDLRDGKTNHNRQRQGHDFVNAQDGTAACSQNNIGDRDEHHERERCPADVTEDSTHFEKDTKQTLQSFLPFIQAYLDLLTKAKEDIGRFSQSFKQRSLFGRPRAWLNRDSLSKKLVYCQAQSWA